MYTRVLIGYICLIYISDLTNADSISNFIVLDKHGENTCIGDLRCYFSLHESQDYTLSFDLTLENNIEKQPFKVVIEQPEKADVMNEQLFLCYDGDKKVATLSAECSSNAIIPPGTYHIDAAITIPIFKDIASMIITGPNGAEGFRGVVSTISSRPPLQLCNPRNGAC